MSLLLQQGESPAYVQRQLGHASIQLTVDTYGKWLPMGNKAAVNRLDDKVVAKTATGTSGVLEVPVTIGGPSRTRTVDPLIKSQLLYQLSYGRIVPHIFSCGVTDGNRTHNPWSHSPVL